jgi:anhydro-N-acetylmuramic acid kinase
VTVLSAHLDDVQAFDTGPANTLIDSFARMAGEGMDRDGRLSAKGQVDDDVLLTLYTLRAPWLTQPPPKSAGYETFGPALAEEVRARHPDTSWPDLVRTAAAFSASTLVEAYEQFILTRFPDLRVVRFSGGGCHNPTLMDEIREAFRRPGLTVATLDQAWIDAKEAIGFALLADRTVRGLPGSVPAATGADAPAVLGTIAFGA